MEIRDLLSRRSDLSTFLVHLTRDTKNGNAGENLKAILSERRIKACSVFGAAKKKKLEKKDKNSQKCVCFTETPLEYTNLLLGKISGRENQFCPYGIAFPKKMGRLKGINPVWYVDISPGHTWLMNPINSLIEAALDDDKFAESSISKITPFIEQMGGGSGYQKEFWWEREWRHVGDFLLPNRIIILCPEKEHNDFMDTASEESLHAVCLDPCWGLERIISHLSGFTRQQSEIF